jgi:competence protein ComEA
MVGFLLPHARGWGYRPLKGYAISLDAIEAATGLDRFASLPDKLEDTLEGSTSLKGWPAVSSSVRPRSSSSSSASGRPAKQVASGPVNVNTASQSQLESLPGIGPVIAGRIIAGRPWRSVNALINVKGIGQKRMAGIRGRVTVN